MQHLMPLLIAVVLLSAHVTRMSAQLTPLHHLVYADKVLAEQLRNRPTVLAEVDRIAIQQHHDILKLLACEIFLNCGPSKNGPLDDDVDDDDDDYDYDDDVQTEENRRRSVDAYEPQRKKLEEILKLMSTPRSNFFNDFKSFLTELFTGNKQGNEGPSEEKESSSNQIEEEQAPGPEEPGPFRRTNSDWRLRGRRPSPQQWKAFKNFVPLSFRRHQL